MSKYLVIHVTVWVCEDPDSIDEDKGDVFQSYTMSSTNMNVDNDIDWNDVISPMVDQARIDYKSE